MASFQGKPLMPIIAVVQNSYLLPIHSLVWFSRMLNQNRNLNLCFLNSFQVLLHPLANELPTCQGPILVFPRATKKTLGGPSFTVQFILEVGWICFDGQHDVMISVYSRKPYTFGLMWIHFEAESFLEQRTHMQLNSLHCCVLGCVYFVANRIYTCKWKNYPNRMTHIRHHNICIHNTVHFYNCTSLRAPWYTTEMHLPYATSMSSTMVDLQGKYRVI